MIQTGPTMRILVATKPVDFRKGIDGLAATCRQQLEQDPMTGCAFVFRNRQGTAIKILLYDGQGYWLCQKRFSTGKLSHWPAGDAPIRPLEAHQLHVLLAGGNAESASGAPVVAVQTVNDTRESLVLLVLVIVLSEAVLVIESVFHRTRPLA
jgi:transposase